MSSAVETVPDDVTLFRAAVQGVRDCLKIAERSPGLGDTLCNGYLEIVNGANPEGQLKRFRDGAKRIADGDIYLTALLKALDNGKSEEEAKFLVLQSVSEQLLARPRPA